MSKPKKIDEIEIDKYEQEIEANFDKIPEYPKDIQRKKIEQYVQAAKEHIKAKKDKRITIRVYEKDLIAIKELAHEEGLPYQTFITSVLHKLSIGRLKVA